MTDLLESERILLRPLARASAWSGPRGHTHDFEHTISVYRGGRPQLDRPPNGPGFWTGLRNYPCRERGISWRCRFRWTTQGDWHWVLGWSAL
jgi:hypothetical protein